MGKMWGLRPGSNSRVNFTTFLGRWSGGWGELSKLTTKKSEMFFLYQNIVSLK